MHDKRTITNEDYKHDFMLYRLCKEFGYLPSEVRQQPAKDMKILLEFHSRVEKNQDDEINSQEKEINKTKRQMR